VGAEAVSTSGLAYSTLACPGWSLERCIEAARAHGYDGLELRLVDGELIDPAMPDEERTRIGRVLAGSGLGLVALDSSVRLTDPAPPAETAAAIRAFLELAVAWGAPLVRVFGGSGDVGRVPEVLGLVAPDAERLGVAVGLETHDSLSDAAAVAEALRGVPSRSVGVVWDVLHTHRMGNTPEDVVRLVGDRVVDIHAKDARRKPDGQDGWDLVLLGEGEVPVRGCLAALGSIGYRGWVVAEWEKRWHPEIEEPEVALPQHARLLRPWIEETLG
jgi:sugar phosphate isomerase/epimerase